MLGALTAESAWPCDAAAVGATRAWTSAQLGRWRTPTSEQRVDDVVLCVSELTTNAINAGSTSITLALDLQDHTLRVSLTDNADGWPVLHHPTGNESHGRGLVIVAALARAWGMASVSAGKVVWATLDW
jgi:anti-sigma regulatory factor (Ser/Thr protein kinase)